MKTLTGCAFALATFSVCTAIQRILQIEANLNFLFGWWSCLAYRFGSGKLWTLNSEK